MNRAYLALALAVAAVACSSPSPDGVPVSVVPELATVDNGSFESNYTGWTVEHVAGPDGTSPTSGTWGIATNGQTIEPGQSVLDFATNTEISEGSPDLPFTYLATDGNQLAFLLVNGPDDNRMFQDVTVPSCQAVVLWDMAYDNLDDEFDPDLQFLAVNIRNPSTDAILATPFETVENTSPFTVSPMTTFTADISAFSGQAVRLDFEVEENLFFFDAEFDNVRVQCKGLSPAPPVLAFGSIPVDSSSSQSTTITNESNATITLSQLQITGPFEITSAPSLPLAIGSGDSTSITAKFTATATGSASGTITLVSNDPNGNTTIPLTGTGLGPSLSVSPVSLTFPNTQTGDTSATQPVTLQNIGGAPLTIDSVSITAPFLASLATPVTLAANGGSATVEVSFSANAAGSASATLEVQASDGETGTVACSGTGQAPSIALSTSALSFPLPPLSGQLVNTTSAPQPVIVTNNGVGDVTLQAIATDASNQFTVVNAPALPATLSAGSAAEIDVAFAPTVAGNAAGSLAITSTSATSPDVVTLTGTAIAPVISAASPVAFGNVHVGSASPQPLVVTNNGTSNLDISALTATAPFSIATTTATIAPGDSQTFTASFTPTAAGSASGTITITSDDPVTPSLVLAATGTGIIGAVSIAPGVLNFNTQRTGTTSAPAVVTISNVGTDTLNISSATLGAGPFAGSLGSTAVAVGSAAQFPVTFSPVVDGAASTLLTVISDAASSPDHIAVTGTGVEPIDTPSTLALAFGAERVGTTSPAQTVTVQNTGTSAMTISAATASAPFAVTAPALPVVLAIGQTGSFSVTFSPTATGAASGTLAIATDATTSPSIGLTGSGTAPAIAAAPTALSFGNQRLGVASAAQTITVSNTGTASLSIASATAPAGYLVTPTAFPVHVLPNATASFSVAFVPTALGADNGTIVFTSDAASSPTPVTVTGTGVQAVAAMSPTAQDFAAVRVGTDSSAIALSITNTGDDAFAVTSITVTPPFVVVSAPSLPVTVAGNSSVPVSVAFDPTATGSAAGELSVATDAGFVSATLTGQGVASAIAASLDPIEYGSVSVSTTSTLALQLTNTGTATLDISSLQLAGGNAADFALTPPPSLPAAVAPGDALTVEVAFTPSEVGARTAQLTAASDALGTAALAVSLAGSGIAADCVLSPSALDFGTTNVGSSSPPLAVTVANTGDDVLVVSAIVLGGADGGDFTDAPALPLVIPAGSATTVAFQFAPTTAGERTATATFTTSDPFAPTSTLALVGGGQTPTIEASPDALGFGGVRVGSDATLPIVVANQGSGSLTISAIAVAGAGAAEFAVGSATLPIVLAPNASSTLQVTYTPAAIETDTAALDLTSNDPINGALTVPLTGSGVSPNVAISPTTLDFGGQLWGRASAPRQVTIQNTGTGPVSVTALAIADDAGSDVFALVQPPTLPVAVSAGGELVLSVTVAPTAIGAGSADLTITTNAAGAPNADVHLTALGMSTALAVSPVSIDFGTTHVAAPATPVVVTLSNLSSDPIQLVDGVVVGPTASSFTVSPIAGALAAGSNATATVTYDPTAAATATATIDFGTTDTSIPEALVTVGGRSVAADLAVDRGMLAFGSIEVGGESGEQVVTVENVTTAPLTIASVSSGDADFTVDTSILTELIASGSDATFGVTFAPARAGAIASSVGVTLTGETAPEVTIAVTGTGAERPSVGGCATGGDGTAAGGLALLVGLVLRRRRRSS